MAKFLKFALERAKEASTYRGIAMVATAMGIGVAPELLTQIVAVGTGVAGLIGMLFPDATKGE